MLTPLQVKNAKPGRHADAKGLYLLVKPSGSKSWVLRVQVDGRRRDYGLGSLDLMSLAEAREKAREWRKLAKDGLDPSAEWKRARRTVPTFEEAATRYHETVKSGWRNGKHKDQWLSTLSSYAFPKIGGLRVDRIDVAEIQSVLLPIWLSKAETARRVRQRIGTVLDYANGQGWRDSEAPMRAVNSLLKGMKQPKARNFAAMPYQELPAFVATLRVGERTSGRRALEFLILTAARSGEVRGATVRELDLQSPEWSIPAARMKMDEPHRVPLVAAAVAVAKEAAALCGNKPDAVLFPGLRNRPLSDMTLSKVLRSLDGGGYTVHGFRAAFRTWAAEKTEFPREWVEAALAHTNPNKVEAAYRRTTFFEQRRKLMNAWEAFLSS